MHRQVIRTALQHQLRHSPRPASSFPPQAFPDIPPEEVPNQSKDENQPDDRADDDTRYSALGQARLARQSGVAWLARGDRVRPRLDLDIVRVRRVAQQLRVSCVISRPSRGLTCIAASVGTIAL